MTIEDAIEANSFYEFSHGLLQGDESLLNALSMVADNTGNVKVGDIVKVSGDKFDPLCPI